jgi:hypothetical protein
MAAIYSNGGNRWNIFGFNFTKRDALSSVYKISMIPTSKTRTFFRSRSGSRNEEKESGVNEQVIKPSDINNRVSSVDINCKPHVTLTQQPTQLAGRLQHFITCWAKLTSDSVILEFVKGVKIEFQNDIEPTQNIGRACNFNVREQVIVESEIKKIIQKCVIIPSVHEVGEFISTIFLRSKKDGSYRTISNLKQFNEFVQYQHFKMDTLDTVIKIMTPGCYMASI